MAFVLGLQLLLDIFFLVALVFWIKERYAASKEWQSGLAPELEQQLSRLETRERQLETELLAHREKMRLQMESLTRIGDEAEKILRRVSVEDPYFSPSVEELELRSLPQVAENIPTLKQLEQTQQRVKSEVRSDLRDLLKSQIC